MVRVHADGEYRCGRVDREAMSAASPYILPPPSTKRGISMDGGRFLRGVSTETGVFVDAPNIYLLGNYLKIEGVIP